MTREGCVEHGVTVEQVVGWWLDAELLDANVSVCGCCLAPCPVTQENCKRCTEAD